MSTFNILLVEDNEGDIIITQNALGNWKEGCSLAIVNDGFQAINYFDQQNESADFAKPDLILMDINMPNMDGKECLKRLKQDANLKVIPVVMLTSSRAPSDILDCYRNYASSYVLKPFGVRAYIDTLRQTVTFWWDLAQRPSHVAW